MRNRLLVSMFAALAALGVTGVNDASAQTAPRSTPDISGVWSLKEGPKIPGTRQELQNGSTVFSLAETKLPLQSWALEKCKTVGCGKDVNALGGLRVKRQTRPRIPGS